MSIKILGVLVNKLDAIIIAGMEKIINNSTSDEKISETIKKQEIKPHFIPKKYRLLGGILQSMNIQFGNYIEDLMYDLLSNFSKDGIKTIARYNKSKSNNFKIRKNSERFINDYITKAKAENFDTKIEFAKLIAWIKADDSDFLAAKHDIDLLFEDKDKIYYVEIKYNDDHDTGKFENINTKLIKTYAYLLNEFSNSSKELIPVLFYFTNKKMKANPYLPEANIYRGKRFFDKFLKCDYDELNHRLCTLAKRDENIKKFDNLFDKISKISKN